MIIRGGIQRDRALVVIDGQPVRYKSFEIEPLFGRLQEPLFSVWYTTTQGDEFSKAFKWAAFGARRSGRRVIELSGGLND